MTRKQRRLILIGASLGVLAIAAALVLSALRDSIVFFNSPTDVAEKHLAPGTRIRVGGLVKTGSLQRGDNLLVRFEVTDGKNDIAVRFGPNWRNWRPWLAHKSTSISTTIRRTTRTRLSGVSKCGQTWRRPRPLV